MRAVALGVLALGVLAPGVLALACGEVRRPLGDECLRDDDCLSGVCADRLCVAAPTLVTGAQGSPPDTTPRIPGPGPDASQPKDAGDGGG